MASTFFYTVSIFLYLLYTSSFSDAMYPNDKPLSLSTPAYLPKQQEEKLIRGLNLSPKKSINTAVSAIDDPVVVPSKSIVEKEINLHRLINAGAAGPSVQEFGHHSGYYKLPHSKDARMFYFFFESRKSKNDPMVIWLTGGPGCSSELALFYENGPFQLAKNLSLRWNEYGWDQASNLLFVDQPTGTGFSYTSDDDDIRHDEKGVSNDLYDFLQAFFAEHPSLAKRDFYITGESYAGHYIPALASRVHQGNKEKQGIHINLKGMAIGNGLTDPEIQYKAYTDYALNMKLIKKSDYNSVQKLAPACEQAIKLCGSEGGESCLSSYVVCNNIFNRIMKAAGGDINHYDIRKKCEGDLCYDFSSMEEFLNKKSVREALGVGNLDFVSCSSTVYDAMITDWMRNLEVGIPTLLEDGIKVLIYAGEYDLICNWLGNSRWVHAMEWSGRKEFVAAPTVPFVVDGDEAGQMKSHGPLTFLKVHDAGHMVPMDQPKASLQMIKSWMQAKIAEPQIEQEIFSRFSSTTPIVIWLSGGPGCSSELALFYENGPFKINNDLSLKWNNYGWDQASIILFVDQPVGTGFSYTSNESEIPHDEQGVSDDLYDFIQEFFKMHPQYVGNDFYITGESYAGHYVPAFAARVSQGNKENDGIHLKLKGIAIGNGLTDPAIQYAAYSDYALDMKLIGKSDHDTINTQMLPQCEKSIEACDKNKGESCLAAFDDCEPIFSQIKAIAGNINHYDIRKQCEGRLCYDFSNMEKFLNEKSVRKALRVGDIEFVSCSSTVYDSMLGDFMRGYDEVIPALLEDGVKVLLYAGEYDLICNWLGNSRWVNAMKWSGQKEFVAAKSVPFVVEGTSAGELISHGGLTFLKVYNAGHLVPMDQPKASLQMLSNWMNGTLT